jgi:signal transduction histidine kinase
MTASAEADEVFSGGGEMGAYMRARDWAQTPLGPLARWSPALRSSVTLLLGSSAPLVLFWGPQGVQLYNDAFRLVLKAKHPRALGQPARACWSEVWHILGPLLKSAEGGPAAWADRLRLLVNWSGFLEEAHLRLAYRSVPDETVLNTALGGVLMMVEDISHSVQGERQNKTLRALAEKGSRGTNPRQVCELALSALAQNRADVPFALAYLVDQEATSAQLAASCGFTREGPSNPQWVDLSSVEDAGWPLSRVLHTQRVEELGDLRDRFPPLPAGDWPRAPTTALLLPLAPPDSENAPLGCLVVGCSPHRVLDDRYRGFLELVGLQLSAAIRSALALEAHRQHAEGLIELDQARSVFFSRMGQEFRTPLSLVTGPLEEWLARPGNENKGNQRRLVQMAHRNALRLQRLLNHFLDFSRFEAGVLRASFEPTDLSKFTSEIANGFRSTCARAGLQLRIDCPPLGEPLFVDRQKWEAIVQHLLSNALNHTFEGGITVQVRDRGTQVAVSVSDTGMGIPEPDGVGVGVTLVQELAKLHGATVSFESLPRRGTAFTVLLRKGSAHLPHDRVQPMGTSPLPSALAPESPDALGWFHEALPDVPLAEPLAAGRPRIVWATAHPDLREYVRRLLAQHWRVVAVEHGRAALSAASEQLPDLVLADGRGRDGPLPVKAGAAPRTDPSGRC